MRLLDSDLVINGFASGGDFFDKVFSLLGDLVVQSANGGLCFRIRVAR